MVETLGTRIMRALSQTEQRRFVDSPQSHEQHGQGSQPSVRARRRIGSAFIFNVRSRHRATGATMQPLV